MKEQISNEIRAEYTLERNRVIQAQPERAALYPEQMDPSLVRYKTKLRFVKRNILVIFGIICLKRFLG